jgi:hypothetical protein
MSSSPSVSRLRAGLAGAAVLAGAAILAPSALGADTVRLSGGTTDLHLNTATARALAAADVSIAPLAPSRARGTRVSFPITGGSIDPRTAAGVVRHSGGLAISSHGTTVRLRNFSVDTRRATLTASVGNSTLQAIDLDTRNASVVRRGSGGLDTYLVRVRAKLSAGGAAALNAAFGTDMFAKGVDLGRVDLKAIPAEVILQSGSTRVALSPVTAGALQTLGVAAAPVAPGTVVDGDLSFPVTGVRLSRAFAGSITHTGGISLTAGSTAVRLTDFRIDLDADPRLTSRVGGSSLRTLNLDASRARAGFSNRTVVIRDVRATLSPDAATALNAAFGVSAFAGGLEFGTARVQARVR